MPRTTSFYAVSTLGVIGVVLSVAAILGFRNGSARLIDGGPRMASRIFEGFAYAGEEPKRGRHINRLLPFRLEPQDLPARFEPGRGYLFHHPLPADQGMSIALSVLAPRLRKEGFKMTETVNGIFYRGFITLDFIGGGGITCWSIQFTRANCVGTIAYDPDDGIRRNPWPVVRRTWDPADYVLRVDGDCGI